MISIIVPVYNGETTVKRAFNSLLNQTIGFENLEVIFIDDNSTDDSSNILQDYSNRYDNVKTIVLDKNSGAGGKPRNIGMNYATCDYVMFLDSDDTFMEDACEVLFDEITKENVDIVSGVHTWDGDNPTLGLWESILTNPVDSYQIRHNKVEDILKNFPLKINSIDECESVIGDFAFTPKIYRKSFLEKNSIKFPEGIIAEDSVFLLNALLNANGIKYVNKIVYHYYHERMGDLNPSMSYIHSKRNLKGLLDSFYKMYYLSLKKSKSEIFKKYLLYPKLFYFLNSRLFKSDLSVGDILDLLIYASPLFKSYVDYNKNINLNLFHFIANKDYENALRFIFGENTLNQKDINVISDVDSLDGVSNLVKLQSDSWLDQFKKEKPDLFIFRQCKNEDILNYCNKNNIPLISISGTENNCLQLLDSIKFKYIPYLKHIVLFYELDDLCQINEIYNHFHSIDYPFKHIKLLTSKDNLFLSNTVLKSDLNTLNLKDNFYFCFADLNLDCNFIQNGLKDSKISDDIKNVVFSSSKLDDVFIQRFFRL